MIDFEAMVFAAGKGTRLGNLTLDNPKCLMQIVGGKTILELIILKLKSAGVSRIVINTYHLADHIKSFLESNNQFDLDISISPEPELLNTGGGLKYAQRHFSGYKPILVHNSDIYSDLDIVCLLDYHKSHGQIATLVTSDAADDRCLVFNDCGNLIGWSNRVTKEEKLITIDIGAKHRSFCGIQCVEPKFFSYLNEYSQKESIIEGYFSAIKAGQTVLEYFAKDLDWIDIGTPEKLRQVQTKLEGNSKNSV